MINMIGNIRTHILFVLLTSFINFSCTYYWVTDNNVTDEFEKEQNSAKKRIRLIKQPDYETPSIEYVVESLPTFRTVTKRTEKESVESQKNFMGMVFLAALLGAVLTANTKPVSEQDPGFTKESADETNSNTKSFVTTLYVVSGMSGLLWLFLPESGETGKTRSTVIAEGERVAGDWKPLTSVPVDLTINGKTVSKMSNAAGKVSFSLTNDFQEQTFSENETNLECRVSVASYGLNSVEIVDAKSFSRPGKMLIIANNTKMWNYWGKNKKALKKRLNAGTILRIDDIKSDNTYGTFYWNNDENAWVNAAEAKVFYETRNFIDRGNPPALSVQLLADQLFDESVFINNSLDAGESAVLNLRVQNSGSNAPLVKLKASLSDPSLTRYIAMEFDESSFPLGRSESKSVKLRILADKQISSGQVTIQIAAEESYSGYHSSLLLFPLRVIHEEPPQLSCAVEEIKDLPPAGNGNRMIEPGEFAEIIVRVANNGTGPAVNVSCTPVLWKSESGLTVESGSGTTVLGDIKNGESKSFIFGIRVPASYNTSGKLPVGLKISETRGRGSYDREYTSIGLALNALSTANDLTASSASSSDITVGIPERAEVNNNAVALVVGISSYEYSTVPPVTFAASDAELVTTYLNKSFGVPPDRVLPRDKVTWTSANLKNYIKEILPRYIRTDSDVYIYIAAHGVPFNEQTFILPYDCNPDQINDITAYSVDEFRKDILSLGGRKKIVVLDACFSGKDGGGTNFLPRNYSDIQAVVTNPFSAVPGLQVFFSSKGNQPSFWYMEKKHSMFTYFFLKGIKGNADSNGDRKITLRELKNFINNGEYGLPYYSRLIYGIRQEAEIFGENEEIVLWLK